MQISSFIKEFYNIYCTLKCIPIFNINKNVNVYFFQGASVQGALKLKTYHIQIFSKSYTNNISTQRAIYVFKIFNKCFLDDRKCHLNFMIVTFLTLFLDNHPLNFSLIYIHSVFQYIFISSRNL